MPADLSANTKRTRQTFQRGQQAEFRFSLKDSGGSPLEPLDALKYPAYVLVAPSGLQMVSGVAQAFGNPGSYRVLWVVPQDAELSSDVASWQLQITFVTSRRSQIQQALDFNVVDKQFTNTGRRDVVTTALEGSPFRAFWRGDWEPYELSLQGYYTKYPDQADVAPIQGSLTKADMTRVDDGDSVVYFVDVPPTAFQLQTALDNSFTFLWSVRQELTSELDVEYQQVRVIKKSMFENLQSLRFMVDRFQHRVGTAQHMSDGDLCEALTQGLSVFNGWNPVTSPAYTTENFPEVMTSWWIMCSMWWMLQSQKLLLNSMSFNYSGQSVSLDFDQSAGIDAALSGLTAWMDAHMTPAKTTLQRRAYGVGSLGVRPYRNGGYNNRVQRIETAKGGTLNPGLLGVANMLGLFP